MTEQAAAEAAAALGEPVDVHYDGEGYADFTPDVEPVRWRSGTYKFECHADPATGALLAWIARARTFGQEMSQLGVKIGEANGADPLAGFDEETARRVDRSIIGLFEPVHLPESQARFAKAIEDREISLRTILAVTRWLPGKYGFGRPPTSPSDSSAGRQPRGDGTTSPAEPPSPASTSPASPPPASSTSPGIG